MDGVVILVALAMVAVMGWLVYQKMRRDEAEFNRQYRFDDEGIHTLGEKAHNQPIQFQGEGAQSTRPVRLEAGDYKIRYQFPDAALVKVEIFSADDGDGEMILLKSGGGEAGFSIDAPGRYLFDIEPQEGAPWKLEINRLGLPSGYRPTPL
ncbi:MAG: hypothetical protein K8I30_16720 [Anaerolineae bacterium]|nr:hypothetical protein [Anaerolineae bacterium]